MSKYGYLEVFQRDSSTFFFFFFFFLCWVPASLDVFYEYHIKVIKSEVFLEFVYMGCGWDKDKN